MARCAAALAALLAAPSALAREPSAGPPSAKREHWLLLQGDMRGSKEDPQAIRRILEAALDEVAGTAEKRGIPYELETVWSISDFNGLLARPGVTSVFFAGHGSKGCLVAEEGALICPADVDEPAAKSIAFYTVACEAGRGDWDKVFASASGNFLMNFAPGISFFRSLQPIHSAAREVLDPFHPRVSQAAGGALEAVHFAEKPAERRTLLEADLRRMVWRCDEALGLLGGIRKELQALSLEGPDAKIAAGAILDKIDKWTERILAARGTIEALRALKPQAEKPRRQEGG